MVVFPGCKINLGLRILNKRNDGYHNLETIFYPVPFTDALEIISSSNSEPIIFSNSGLAVDGDSKDNICMKAYWLLKKDFPQLPSITMHLHKCIPMGAGLGGGSADAAFSLRLLNQLFHLQISTEKLIDYAAQLGSDCAFFILNKPCLATGRGEILHPIALNLSGYTLALVNPGIHVNTGAAFAALKLHKLDGESSQVASLTAIMQQPISSWKHTLINDFEEPVSQNWPVIKEIKEKLYSMGAVFAAMSGSGSTVFGLFDQQLPGDKTDIFPFFTRFIQL
ncbi:4-(cytidine 5'-diphospho)-2-C-methyl-D-erythritol kinase [Ferruginibacter paludis]|uniref:4-(cytidine 5'-diphospho)-2-C-methyl-D-erythritol kinase n=1 Tax=Ferruginibacter paludis TaxID=1310417 RepID=UPI0025B3A640|nr:4-(cytidine 5'-diphospho)-2-C-methyl-D-erythritol kinase [Ferruginibacter paludis]MDN3657082.1 4-(cytidine 5'-diphospho)-2-C-methyl-D-erythritol kinase [Ferruginibacter paludis]